MTYFLNDGCPNILFFFLLFVSQFTDRATVSGAGYVIFEVSEDVVEVVGDEILGVDSLSGLEAAVPADSLAVLVAFRVQEIFDGFNIIIR